MSHDHKGWPLWLISSELHHAFLPAHAVCSGHVCRPNDAAIQTFLKQMGLTVDDLKKRPLLAKELAGQHIILKHNVRPAELFANGPARIVATATGKPNDLLFTRGADGTVRVSDVQGHTAKVGKSFFIDSKKTGHGIDKVLMPGKIALLLGTLTRIHYSRSLVCCAESYALLRKDTDQA